ncbi:MAG: elongation factor P 5-aminopentanone reductase [Coprococcus sp.]
MHKKTVFITGASRGIGRAIALRFAAAGYNLAVCCLNNKTMLDTLKSEVCSQYGVDCLTFTGDTGDYHVMKNILDLTFSRYHQIDVLVNNAGISYIGLLTDMGPDDWHRIVNTNLTSVFNCCRLTVPQMVQRQTGKIINISSVWGCCGASCEVAYSATKGGINAFTQALARELAPSNIQVNAIACGAIDTEMNQFLSHEDRQALIEEIPAGRFGLPEEVAELVLDLAEKHPYMNGQIIRLDGSWT